MKYKILWRYNSLFYVRLNKDKLLDFLKLVLQNCSCSYSWYKSGPIFQIFNAFDVSFLLCWVSNIRSSWKSRRGLLKSCRGHFIFTVHSFLFTFIVLCPTMFSYIMIKSHDTGTIWISNLPIKFCIICGWYWCEDIQLKLTVIIQFQKLQTELSFNTCVSAQWS
jgi:hypothetical protein